MQITLFILLFAALSLGIYRLMQKVQKSARDDFDGNPINPEQIAKRRENLDKIQSLAQTQGRINNNDVEKALGVSDATATRYLEYLVTLGKLRRIGERGQGVYYQNSLRTKGSTGG